MPEDPPVPPALKTYLGLFDTVLAKTTPIHEGREALERLETVGPELAPQSKRLELEQRRGPKSPLAYPIRLVIDERMGRFRSP